MTITISTSRAERGKPEKSVPLILPLVAFALAFAGCGGGPTRVPLRGFVDLHTHPMINLAFGGKLVHGGVDGLDVLGGRGGGSLIPTDLLCHNQVPAISIADALGPDSPSHAPGLVDLMNPLLPINPAGFPCGDTGRAAIISGLQWAFGARVTVSPAGGFPLFDQWPAWDDITHQKMWVEWIERARIGGLRVMVALATNNRTLGDAVVSHVAGELPTDDRASGDLQLNEIKAFVNRHPETMELAMGSADVDRIARADKIAVVLGVELDNIGNFNSLPPGALTIDIAAAEIQRLYDGGVRYIFPVHVVNNAFGATAIYENTFNTANRRETGDFWEVECAPSDDKITHLYVDASNFLQSVVGLFRLGLDPFAHPPAPPSCTTGTTPPLAGGHRNSKGLTSLGASAIKEMMKRGMIIDIDHMSQRSADYALAVADAFGYPLVSGHTGIRGMAGADAENSRTPAQLAQISKQGGMFGLGSDGADAHEWAQLYQAAMIEMGYLNADSSKRFYDNGAVALGTDLNGLVKGPKPGGRDNVKYDSGFEMSHSGSKSWDYNVDGVAHYGMLPDFIKDVQTAPSNGTVSGVAGTELVDQHLLSSAEYFWRMWWKIEVLAGANTIK